MKILHRVAITSICNMKSERHQGNALTGASIKMTYIAINVKTLTEDLSY